MKISLHSLIKTFLSSLLLLVITFVSTVASTSLAHAQQAPKPTHYANGTPVEWDGDNIKGICATELRLFQRDSDQDQLFWVTMPDGQKLSGYCIDKGQAGPNNDRYNFTATASGGGAFKVVVDSQSTTADGKKAVAYDIARFGTTRYKTNSLQRIGIDAWHPRFKAPEIKRGKITLKKVSASPDITDGNSAYSLAGAVFGVYRDQACTNEATTLTTDASGNAVSGELDAGQYWIKEKTAPKGYALNSEVKSVTVTAGQPVPVQFADEPKADPVGVVVQKKDKDSGKASPLGEGTLAGAKFRVNFYKEDPKTGKISDKPTRSWTIVTDEKGKAVLGDVGTSGSALYKQGGRATLPIGKVTIQEISPPKGYLINDETHEFDIDGEGGSGTARALNNIEIPEQVKRGGVKLQKYDEELRARNIDGAQGKATLAGGVFEIISNNEQDVVVDGKTYKKGEVVATIETDEDGVAESTDDLLPYGTYTIKESEPPEGYLLNAIWSKIFQIREDKEITTVGNSNPYMDEAVIRGGVRVQKHDDDSKLKRPAGAAHFKGTEFKIVSDNDQPVVVDNVVYYKGEVVKKIVIKKDDGIAETDIDSLPYGDYTIYESKPPEGYLLNKEWSQSFQIREHHKIVTVDDKSKNIRVDDLVKRGDFDFVKVDEMTMARIANCPFLVTSKTTGEAHVIVTDANGYFSSSIKHAPHSHNTNANDLAYDRVTGKITDRSKLSPTNGLWFSGYADYMFDAIDSRGALPYDTYSVKEILLPGVNGQYDPIEFTIVVSRNGYRIFGGTVDNHKVTRVLLLSTTLTDSDTQSHFASAAPNCKLVDKVLYSNLMKGQTYTFKAVLIDAATGMPVLVDGKEVTAEKTITIGGGHATLHDRNFVTGEVELSFTFDAAHLSGKTLVSFVSVYQNDILMAEHADISDKKQSVMFPGLTTKARNLETNTQQAFPNESIVVIDTITYNNLETHKTYKIKGALVNRKTKEVLATAERIFKPTASRGTLEMQYTFDGSKFAGQDVVIFEEIFRADISIARHHDADDPDQIIHFPKITTKARGEKTKSFEVLAEKETTIVDTVSYTNLTPGATYTLRASLMYEDETPVMVGGEKVTATETFEARTANGTRKVRFTFDARSLAGKTVVVLEELYDEHENLLAEHKDFGDTEQTIRFPKITTEARGEKTKTHEMLAEHKASIIDTVSYTNLTPTRTYIMRGVLYDKETGEPILVDGRKVTGQTTFKPEEYHGSGTVSVTFTFDALELAGKTLVVVERLYDTQDNLIAEHKDLKDALQTITIPKITTKAHDIKTETHEALAEEKVTIVDTIIFKNVIPQTTYVLRGTLYDKATGEPILVDGKPVKTHFTFIPQEKEGTQEVRFVFDGRGLAGRSVVVFEELYDAFGNLLARHTDISDKSQTINLPKIETFARDSKTKTHESKAEEDTLIIDRVTYQNLTPGATYTLRATVIDKATKAPILVDGKIVTQSVSFVPVLSVGTQKVRIAFDARTFAGKTVVIFEELFNDDNNIVGLHQDLEDVLQTIRFPKITTEATGEKTKTHELLAEKEVVVIDTVSYQNLTPGATYTLRGTLVDKKTGDSVLVDGAAVTADATFVAATRDGTQEVRFVFDARGFEGRSVVVYERLYDGNDHELASHEDIADPLQAVHFPKVTTKALGKKTGTHELLAEKDATIVDTVSFENLRPGSTYILRGTLIDKATEKPVLVDNKEVTAEATFVAEKDKGTQQVNFVFDARSLAGKSLVVFEELYDTRGNLLALHKDAKDALQTIDLPKITTNAYGEKTARRDVPAEDGTVVIDVVSYENVTKGATYTLRGTLVDKVTGKPVFADGKKVTTQATFVAEDTKGTQRVHFVFNAEGLAGRKLVVFEELLDAQGNLVAEHEDLNDEFQTITLPKITTEALSEETGTHEVLAEDDVAIVDTVSYQNLTPGATYTLRGVLIDQDTGRPLFANGKKVTAKVTFVPKTASGTKEMRFVFDAEDLAGKSVVVFQELYDASGILMAYHRDIDDEDQTINFPKIETEAEGKKTKTREILAEEGAVIIDTVTYTNLTPGNSYTLRASLVDQKTGKALRFGGRKIIAKRHFVPDEKDGTVRVRITFDARDLAGKTVVVFEELYDEEGNLLAYHKDTLDILQTVKIPKVETLVHNPKTKTREALAEKGLVIIDTIRYENLTRGDKYTVRGTLIDKATGKPVLVDGKEVTAKTTFVARRTKGTQEVRFVFNAEGLAGKTLVVFEEIYDESGNLIAEHKDLSDELQTITLPKIETKALGEATKTHEVLADEVATIVDTVTYKNLIVGNTYTLRGTLIDKATGKSVLIDGKKITTSVTFVARTKDGTQQVRFVFDARSLAGKTLVVFEELLDSAGNVVAIHRDILDVKQTIKFLKIETKACDGKTKTQEIRAEKDAVIIDTVTYTNLTPGKTYTLRGVLIDKETGKPILVDGKEVTASVTFVPKTPDGTQEVRFVFDARGLEGKTLVVFEELLDENGNVVALHKDINDAAQTIFVKPKPKPRPVAKLSKTGDESTGFATFCTLSILAVIFILAGILIRRLRQKKEGRSIS